MLTAPPGGTFSGIPALCKDSWKMNCPRVLHAFGGHPQPPVMPVDLAVCLGFARPRPLYQLLAPPTPNGVEHHPTEGPPRPRSCFRRLGLGLGKKRVTFADAVGLALTAVRYFIPEPATFDPLADSHLLPSQAQDQQRHRLRPGLAHPLPDSKAHLGHQETPVQLESCDISENSLIGKVSVSRDGVKKAVWIRLTFDSWRSFRDFPCALLRQLPPAVDVYAFDLCLPKNVDPNERVEFCVFCKAVPGSTTRCDNNWGKNYTVHLEKDGSHVRQGHDNLWRPTSLKQRPPLRPPSALQSL